MKTWQDQPEKITKAVWQQYNHKPSELNASGSELLSHTLNKMDLIKVTVDKHFLSCNNYSRLPTMKGTLFNRG